MLKTILFSSFILIFFQNSIIAQISNEDICNIYEIVIQELKVEMDNYKINGFFISNQIIIINDCSDRLKSMETLFDGNLESNNIQYEKFNNKTLYTSFNCKFKDINLINESEYYCKLRKYKKKLLALFIFSNINYYDNFAFLYVRVTLPYGLRTYGNYYFLKKVENWEIIYSKLGVD